LNPLYLLIGLTTVTHIASTGTRFAVTMAALKLGASPFDVGLLMAAFALLPMLIAVKAGRIADRIGVRLPMMVSAVVAIAAVLLPFFWHTLTALFITSIFLGGAGNVIYMSTQPLVGRYGKPEDRPANFGLFAMGYSTSSFVGPVLAGFAIDYISVHATFLLLAVLPLPILAVLALNRLPLAGERAQRAPEPGKESARSRSVLELLREPRLFRLYAIGVLFATAWDMFIVLAPVYCASVGLSASRTGIVTGMFSIGTFLIRGTVRPMSRYFAPWQLLILSSVGIGLSTLGFGLVATFPLLVAFALLLGLGHGLSAPMINTLLYEAAPPDRIAEAVGLRITASNAIQTTLPMVAGAIGAAVGIAPVFWGTALVLLGGGYITRSQWHTPRDSSSRDGAPRKGDKGESGKTD
jgi:MFS family permease